MAESHEKHIAAQALKALHLRRQLERGDLTHQEYLDHLNVLQKSPAPAPGTAAGPTRDPGKHRPSAAEPRPKLIGALEVLQLRRRLDNGELTPQEYLAKLQAQPDTEQLPEQKLEPVQASAPDAAPTIPGPPAIVTAQAIPERFLAMNCPRCAASLKIYHQFKDLQCSDCGADLIVERQDCTIALRLAGESIEEADAIAAPAASAKRDEELQKLRAEAAMVVNVKRSAGILGGLCGLGFAYVGIADIAARDIATGAVILTCGSALLGTVVCITRHTTKVRAGLNARIRAITTSEEYSADHP